MLGYMIERISGRPLREYVKETVLEPLVMDNTDWYYEPDALKRFVKPYRVVDGRLELIDPEHDMIALFYINMYGAESLYPSFLGNAYQLITE
jgi:CubicO group peptidase (beta-lactamase class C family)